MYRRKRRQKSVGRSTSIVEYVCPQCKFILRIPQQVVRDFSLGGKEYHKGGETSFVCIKCRAMIPMQRGK